MFVKCRRRMGINSSNPGLIFIYGNELMIACWTTTLSSFPFPVERTSFEGENFIWVFFSPWSFLNFKIFPSGISFEAMNRGFQVWQEDFPSSFFRKSEQDHFKLQNLSGICLIEYVKVSCAYAKRKMISTRYAVAWCLIFWPKYTHWGCLFTIFFFHQIV